MVARRAVSCGKMSCSVFLPVWLAARLQRWVVDIDAIGRGHVAAIIVQRHALILDIE